MNRPTRITIIGFGVVLALFLNGAAHSLYFTYAQWAELPLPARVSYLSGLYDGMFSVVFSPDQAQLGKFFKDCTVKLEMNNVQMTNSVTAFAASRPKLQQSVVSALNGYLVELCGKPPQ